MRMRWKPNRGERFKDDQGQEYTILESRGTQVRCLGKNGLVCMIAKDSLNLPIIDTKNYEKL